MKNRVLTITFFVLIACLTAINLNISKSEISIDIELLQKQAMADGEYAGWDNFWQGQGFYKDESEVREPCPIYESSSDSGSVSGGGYSGAGSGSSEQVNPDGRTDIRCSSGSDNCTSVDC